MYSDKVIGIVGLGGLGGFVSEEVARLNPKKIIIFDQDIFQESNLNRQLYSSFDNIGKNKADVTSSNLKKISHSIIESYNEFVDESNIDKLKECDIVFDCLDNIKSRLILSEYLSKNNIPLIHGAISSTFGEVILCLPERDILKDFYKDKDEIKVSTNSYSVSMIASLEVALMAKYFKNDYKDLIDKVIIVDLDELTLKKLSI